MKKSIMRIITLVLTLSLIFGISASTVAYASEADLGKGSIASTLLSGSAEPSGSVVTGWCDIDYDENGVVVTLTPDKEELLGITKTELKQILDIVINAAKALVIDDIKNQILDSISPDLEESEDASGITVDNLWMMAINGYINQNPEEYPDGAENSYVLFLQNAIKDESDTVIGDFIDYACRLIESALAAGVVTVDKLPDAADIEGKIVDIFNQKVDEFISKMLPQYTDEYLEWLEHGTPCSNESVQNLITEQVEAYIKDAVTAYVNNGFVADANDVVSSSVAKYLDNEIKLTVDTYIKNFANGVANPVDVDNFIKHYFDSCVTEILDNWPNKVDNPVSSVAHDEIAVEIKSRIKLYIDDYFNGTLTNETIKSELNAQIKLHAPEYIPDLFWEYRDKAEKPAWVITMDAELEKAIKAEIEAEIKADVEANKDQYVNDNLPAIKAQVEPTLKEKFVNEYGVEPTQLQLDTMFDEYIASAEGQAKIDEKLAEKITEKVEEEYASFTTSDIKAEIEADPDLTAKFNAEIANAVNGTDDFSGWGDVWAEIGEIKQESIVDTVIANVAKTDAVKSIITEYCDGEFLQKAVKRLIENENEYSKILDKLIADAKTDAVTKELLVDKINDRIADTDTVISTFRTALSYLKENVPETYDELSSKIAEKVKDESEKPETIGKAYEAYFGMSEQEVNDKVLHFVDLLVVDYTALYEKVTANPEAPELTPEVLLSYLSYVSVTEDGVEYMLYKDGKIDAEAAKDLALTLPTPTEIAQMSGDDMMLDYTFDIATIFGNTKFDIKLVLKSGHEYVKKLAAFIAEHIDIYVDSYGTVQVNVNVPAKFAELLVRAAKSEKLPETLKKKVFAALSKSPDDAYALFNELSFEDIIAIIEKAPIDEYLDAEFLSRFEKLDNLSKEQIVEKIKEYQHYYNRLCDYIVVAYENYFPESYKDKTVTEFYNGNGNFDIGGSYTLDVKKLLIKVSEKYGAIAASFISKDKITVSAHLDVTFENINKVEYRINGTTVIGFLPAGASLTYFAGVSYVDGYLITEWNDIDTGISYNTMPDCDVVLEPVYTKPVAIIVDSDGAPIETVSKDYNKDEVVLGVSVKYEFTEPTFTYQWYKDGEAIEGATNATYSVKNVSDNGEYYCIVSVKDGAIDDSYESSHVAVSIKPIDVTGLENIKWNYTGPYAYNGSDYTVLIDKDTLPEFVAVDESSYKENVKKVAGKYTASVKLTVTNSNYKLPDGFEELTQNWEIVASVLDLDKLEWAFEDGAELEYNANTQSVYLKNIGNVEFTYEGNEGRNVGQYKAKVTGYVNNDENYTLVIGSLDNVPELSWSIVPKNLDLSTFKWDYEGKNFVFDGETEHKVLLTGLGELESYVEYKNNTSINAGTFEAEAKFSSDFASSDVAKNYNFGDSQFASLTWSVAKKQYAPTFAGWNASSFVYSGNQYEVYLVDEEGNRVVDANISYTGNVATDVGSYVAYAVLTEEMQKNYSIAEIKHEWTIDKRVIDISGLTWDYEDGKFTYNYGEKFTVKLTNVGDLVFSYTGNVESDAGTHTAVATLDERYNDTTKYVIKDGVSSLTLDWEINKLTVQVGSLTWKLDGAAVYDGTLHSVYLVDANGDAVKGVSYTNNSFTDAGTYTATVKFDNPNCIYEGQFTTEYTWTIEKAVFDLSGIKFEDTTVTFNGAEHKIPVIGIMEFLKKYPGTTYTLDPASVSSIGTYDVTVTFTNKNYQDASLSAVLTIKPAVYTENEFEIKDTEGQTIVSIVGTNGLSTNHVLDFIDVSADYSSTVIPETVFKNASVVGAYDIHFKVDGSERPVSDEFTVKLLIPETLRAIKHRLAVVYIAENGDVEDMKASVDGDYMVFATTHFSIYAIVDLGEGSSFPWLLVVAIILILIALIIVLLVVIRKGKTPEDRALEIIEPIDSEDGEASEETLEEESTAPEAAEEPAEEETAPEAAEESAEEETAPEAAEEPAEEETAPEAAEEPAEEETAPEAAEEPAEEETAPEAAEEPAEEETAPEAAEEPAEEETAPEAPADEPKEPEIKSEIILSGDVEIPVRYRHSFMSRLIQAEPPIQDYYTAVKNALLSYKGVKCRTSWNFESFNRGREQCAKLNVKGKNFLVYLNLDPNEYNVNKYHFQDVSGKPKVGDVPMLLKVKSERGLKYAVELIYEMMSKFGFERIDVDEVDYHMPYETTEELAKRDLVKVILPAGVKLDKNSNVVKLDVGELLDAEKKADGKIVAVVTDETEIKLSENNSPVVELVVEEISDDEIATEAVTVAETVAEEPVVEEATDEAIPEAVEEATVEEATVEEATVEEVAAEEELVAPIDVQHADELLTDKEAEDSILVIDRDEKDSSKGNKMGEINIDTISDNFHSGDTVTLKALKQRKLVPQTTGRIKVLARGSIDKRLTVIADKFSLQAVKMITLAGGIAEQYRK